ncbi:YheU family protein [Bdellovibrio bacteriovorus]|uniref:YheU family protein n=1 Tax=Bdellovibrio bacteriovorus TaxID=959 RepID=UPI0035A743A2
MNDNEKLPPMEVPQEALSPEALRGIIESFILREGTDYGREEAAFETKFNQIKKQLDKGDVKIVFDPNTETVGIVTKIEWQRLLR